MERALDPQRPDWLAEEVWPFELRSVRLEGTRVSYTDVGDGPTLLFCHAGMWSFLWRDVLRALVDTLELDEVTLVLHDLGGPTALAAAAAMPERVAGLAAVNTFGWRPSGLPFRTMLAVFGSAWMRELDARTGWLPAASTSRFGVGRQLDRPSRRAFRRGMDREARRTMHLLFRSARQSEDVFVSAARGIELLRDRPVLTVFGALGDYLRFRPKWRARFVDAHDVTVPWGLHFPMCDDPHLTATSIDGWHRRHVAPRPDGPRIDEGAMG